MTGTEDTVARFKDLVEAVVRDDELTKGAIQAVVEASGNDVAVSANTGEEGSGSSTFGGSAAAIAQIMESHRQFKLEALKLLHEFLNVHA